MTGAITNIATTIIITTTADAITDVGDGCSRPRLLGHQQRSGDDLCAICAKARHPSLLWRGFPRNAGLAALM